MTSHVWDTFLDALWEGPAFLRLKRVGYILLFALTYSFGFDALKVLHPNLPGYLRFVTWTIIVGFALFATPSKSTGKSLE